ncbi:MAG: helix-turn-helix transcriptional regulator [Propioniciclava sp.]
MAQTVLGPEEAAVADLRPSSLTILRALVALGQPGAIADLTPDVGGHPNSVRLHLAALVRDGLAELVAAEARGRGRPAKRYTPTVHGRQIAEQDAELDDFHALIEAVADHLSASENPTTEARELGRAWGRRLTRRASDRDLFASLGAQGFTPERDGDQIRLRTCPFLRQARERPALICALHHGLVDALADEPVRLEPFAVPGACLIRAVPADRPDQGASCAPA